MTASGAPDDPIPRPAARVILLDPRDRVLLINYVIPETGHAWWCTPGGALEPAEGAEEAARRELAEETGLLDVELGPCVWVREHVFPMNGKHWLQQERYYTARVEPFEVETGGALDYELEMVRGHRWWSVDELEATGEVIAPRRLGQLLRALLSEGSPPEPVDVGL